ncbi:hypothetical protein GCM10017559_71530 [Streptosporangium longisporum]|uniref:Tubulin/FtsZ 2-layer sandwich domain-containing protein n=1 Tax=Streptosporangium longisporum TaxID=46187 RepID=A0ABP6L693_9ACTN
MAVSSPLLEASIDGAHGVLLSIAGGSDLGLFEINEAAQLVSTAAAPDANIIFGTVIDDALGDEVRVTVIAAGFDEPEPAPKPFAQPVARPQQAARPAPAQQAAAPVRPLAPTAKSEQRPELRHEPRHEGPPRGQARAQGGARPAPAGAAGRHPAARARGSSPPSRSTRSSPRPPRPRAASRTAGRRPHTPPLSIPRPAPRAVTAHADLRAGPGPRARRRPVIFEEQEEELDVPDFLK